MNCWQRKRGTRTSVTSWIRPSLSWRATEVSPPHSHPSPALRPLHCCQSCKANHTVHLSIKQKASTSLHYCLFVLECVYEAMSWPNVKKDIWKHFLIIILRLYLSSFCTKRGVYRDGISVTPKAAYGTNRALFSLQCNGWCAGKGINTIKAWPSCFFFSMTGSYSNNDVIFLVSADVWIWNERRRLLPLLL